MVRGEGQYIHTYGHVLLYLSTAVLDLQRPNRQKSSHVFAWAS
jgi:hypothetical protein